MKALKKDLDLHARFFAKSDDEMNRKISCVWDQFSFPEPEKMRSTIDKAKMERDALLSSADELLESVPEKAG